MNEATRGFSWATRATYLCSCGASFAATRQVWVDAETEPALASSVRSAGPYAGVCPDCGAPAVGRGVFLEVRPSKRQARLCIPSDRRGEAVEALAWHAEQLRGQPGHVADFMLRPHLEFVAASLGELRRMPTNHTGVGVPVVIGGDRGSSPPPRHEQDDLGVHLGTLHLEGDEVRVEAQASGSVASLWHEAHLTIRPIHLRDEGYPLVGVRVVGSHTGQQGCIDAVVDVGHPSTLEIFRLLSERFRLRILLTDDEAGVCDREVSANGLERNAALCLESAQAALASGEYPPSAYEEAVARLSESDLATRLLEDPDALRPGAYRHLVGPKETWHALEHLDRASRREVVSRLLEVEGLPFGEYEKIRRRVLAASIAFGLCAPRRFWRRVVASGMAADLEEYADTLAANRAAALGGIDDLTEDEQDEAWNRIEDLCQRKHLSRPLELREALGLSDDIELLEPDPEVRVDEAAGEIGPSTSDTAVRLQQRLQDPDTRLCAAIEALAGRVDDRSLALVLDMLEDLETEELLALLPDLSELGARVTPGLVAKLASPRREVRQAAIILLGLSRATDALPALAEHLIWEPTTVWVDAARALGSFGERALSILSETLEGLAPKDQQGAVGRVSRAFAEVAVETEDGGRGRAAVEALEDDESRPLLATAAARALATLRDVSESGAQIRGELPLPEVTEVRGFSRRAYEAIMVPELELIEDVEPEA